ncbi:MULTISPECIES: L,D-transpeptidase [Roseinatronobacter]|uniref:L,D-transpeptidase n=1 Tax=Roseinatronobacter domitianus TaxID=2940293 RepID=A0ABT0M215_9RHOB|nr:MULTISPECIES: L,D-transpeptidase [Roseibaca]MCL1628902.1 L,D-transpeptidase [Roseibaca domitiana]
MRPLLAALAALLLFATSAMADRVVARVSISEQKMYVYHHGTLVHEWPVSTARAGKITPTGDWRPQWLSKNHRSSRYNNAPMPYAIFYSGHYAIHGTDQISRLGRPASAGCVRLDPANASVLFDMVRQEGMEQTRVIVRR